LSIDGTGFCSLAGGCGLASTGVVFGCGACGAGCCCDGAGAAGDGCCGDGAGDSGEAGVLVDGDGGCDGGGVFVCGGGGVDGLA
jgi:hypothetical protein